MSNFPSISELLKNTAVRAALAVVALMAIGSITYFLIESQPPKVAYAAVATGNITQEVTATGEVTPVQNPTLSFEQGGQVTTVSATAGEKVTAGTFLASLDTRVLSASLAAAQAQLNSLESGPRSVDVAGQQTGVLEAQQTLANTFASYPQTLLSAYTTTQSSITTQVDPLFNFSSPSNPVFISNSGSDPSQRVQIDAERSELISEFSTWDAELSVATSSPDALTASQLQTLTDESIDHLDNVRSFLNDLSAAIIGEQTSSSLSAQQTAGLASVSSALSTVNGLITSLTAAGQSISTQQLAVQSAQDQLNQTQAGATTQAIQAQQAVVEGIEAQIAQQEIVAPFSGTVASVSIKPGDVVSANTPAISLIPNGTFEVDLYLAENDVTKVKVGDTADVTLDAYGTGRIFPATVGAVETSPSINPDSTGGTTGGYKVTLVFDNADPAIANGMHASATIHTGSAENVLIIPSSAVITNGTAQFVLKETAQGLVQTPVTIGLTSTSTVEVLSGLSAGDSISAVGSQS
jgi:HlyD family secretion protein